MSAERSWEPFSILETMRLEDGRLVRRERHVARARATADALGAGWKGHDIGAAVDATMAAHPSGVWRVRLLVSIAGDPALECTPFVHDRDRVWRVALGSEPVASSDPFLRHKTTRRRVYDSARASRPEADDALLWNEHGEITESSIANVVAELAGVRVTPPLACGLLPGVFRAVLLETGEIEEGVLTKEDLSSATRLWLINSLREWIPASLVP